jgi:hypothetical protein
MTVSINKDETDANPGHCTHTDPAQAADGDVCYFTFK